MLLAALGDGSVQLWRASDALRIPERASAAWACVQQCSPHSGSVLCLAEVDGVAYCGAADCAISKLQLPTAATSASTTPDSPGGGASRLVALRKIDNAHQADVHALTPYGTDRLISAGADTAIRIWSLPQMQPLYSLRASGRPGEAIAHDGAVYALLVVSGTPPRLFSASADCLIKAWDLRTMSQIASLVGHQSFVCALQESNGCLLSASCDKTLGVWCLTTYEKLRVLNGHKGGLYSLTVHMGRACSGSLDETIRVWTEQRKE